MDYNTGKKRMDTTNAGVCAHQKRPKPLWSKAVDTTLIIYPLTAALNGTPEQKMVNTFFIEFENDI